PARELPRSAQVHTASGSTRVELDMLERMRVRYPRQGKQATGLSWVPGCPLEEIGDFAWQFGWRRVAGRVRPRPPRAASGPPGSPNSEPTRSCTSTLPTTGASI